MSDDVLEREELRDHLFVAANNAGAAEAVLAHDAALRERVAELDILRKNISAHVNAAIAGHITEAHAVGEIAAELDDYDARQALEAQDDRE